MLHPDMEDMIDDAFANHEISEAPVKSWLIKNPDGGAYWFYVTWSPGMLTLHGDLGELTLVHYQAMKTWEDAVAWVNDGNEEYMLGKSNVEKKFNQELSAESIIDMADNYLNDEGDPGLWVQIFSLADGCFDNDGRYFLQSEHDITNEEHRRKAMGCIVFSLTPEFIYHNFQFDDWYGRYEYTEHHKWQIRAIQTWAAWMAKNERQRTVQTVSG